MVRNPVMNSPIGTARRPVDEAMWTSAPSANRAEIVSLAGLAVITLPATVARLRSCGDPISRHACASGNT